MKYLIISDLHLCDATGRDLFGTNLISSLMNQEKLKKWIDSQKADVLVLNGDIYDRWRCPWWKSRFVHSSLISFFKKKKAIWLDGNHDHNIFRKSKLEITMWNGKRVVVTHGYQNDKKNMLNPFAMLGVYIFGRVEQVAPFLDNLGQSIVDGPIEQKTSDYAIELLSKYDYVVLGHTHNQKKVGSYYNSGCCIHGKTQGVMVDTTKNTVTLV